MQDFLHARVTEIHYLPLHIFLVAQTVKNLPARRETQVQSLGREDPLEKKWHPTPVFLPGESHGQRSLVGHSPYGCKEFLGPGLLSLLRIHAYSLSSCPTLCNLKNYSLPGSSVHGILQSRILEWVAMTSSKRSSQPRDRTRVSCTRSLVLFH